MDARASARRLHRMLSLLLLGRCGGALSAAEARGPLLPELRRRSRTRLRTFDPQGCRAEEISLRCLHQGAAQGPDEAVAASSQLHKQLLAQEVVKLRREVATLRAADSAPGPASSAEEEEIRSRDYLLDLCFMCCVSFHLSTHDELTSERPWQTSTK